MTTEQSSGTQITESAATLILGLYKQLLGLVHMHEKHSVGPTHIEKTELLAEELLLTLKRYPHQAIAQFQIYKPNLYYFHNFCFNTILFCGLLLLRNKMNLSAAQQIMSGVLSWLLCSRNDIESLNKEESDASPCHFETIKAQLIRALGHYNRSLWLEILTSRPGKSLRHPATLISDRNPANTIHSYQGLSLAFAVHSTRVKGRNGQSFPQSLKFLVQHSNTFALSLLEPLLDFPGNFAPGSVIVLENKQRFMVLGLIDGQIYALAWQASTKSYHTEIKTLCPSQVISIQTNASTGNVRLIDIWWGREWQSLLSQLEVNPSHSLSTPGYKIDRPPASLLAVIEQLNKPSIDIPRLTEIIENEPDFAKHITDTASHQSRANLKISKVKHGLLMNGIDRTRSVLIEKALITRLSQNQFPLLSVVYQFVKLWAYIAAAIAQRHPKLLPEECSCWVHFAASGLFTHAEIKSQLAWKLPKTQNDHSNEYQFSLQNPGILWQHALQLSVAWSQDRKLNAALKDAHTKSNLSATAQRSEIHTLISLSLRMTAGIFLHGTLIAPNDDEYIRQFLHKLGISNADYREVMTQALEGSHTYWPIHNKMVLTG